MKVYVRHHSITQQDRDLIQKILGSVNIVDYEIINTLYYNEPENKELCISFGIRLSPPCLNLPALSKLIDIPSNEISRLDCWNKLKALQSHQAIEKQIDPLPTWDARKVLGLEKFSTGNLGVTLLENNKSIRVSFSPDDKVKEDINISFQQLLTIKLITELFKENKQ